MNDKVIELCDQIADEAFGDKGMVKYSERQEMSYKIREFISSMQDLNPEYNKIVNDNFWDLI